jgi:DNA-binding NarL/FixJ family response regulator
MSIRILIAEDSAAVRNALRHLLEHAGPWQIIDVDNGEEAVTKAQELKPDLIILDLVMPVMDGLNAARQISKLLPNTPMLMHTMHWSQQVEIEAQKVGVRKVVSKSDSAVLISTVRQFLTPEPTLAGETTPTVSSDIAVPNAAPPPAILEAASTATPAKPDAPATPETDERSENGAPN